MKHKLRWAIAILSRPKGLGAWNIHYVFYVREGAWIVFFKKYFLLGEWGQEKIDKFTKSPPTPYPVLRNDKSQFSAILLPDNSLKWDNATSLWISNANNQNLFFPSFPNVFLPCQTRNEDFFSAIFVYKQYFLKSVWTVLIESHFWAHIAWVLLVFWMSRAWFWWF